MTEHHKSLIHVIYMFQFFHIHTIVLFEVDIGVLMSKTVMSKFWTSIFYVTFFQ